MKNLIIASTLAAFMLISCNSKKTPDKTESLDNINVSIGESEFNALSHLIKREGRNDWHAGTSYFGDAALWEYRFTDEESKSHAVQIQNEGIIMAVIFYRNPDGQGHELAYIIEKDRAVVWVIDIPGKLFSEKEVIDIVKKDYNALLAKAEE